MTNLIPYSTEAIETLVAVEREHSPRLLRRVAPGSRNKNTQFCRSSFCYGGKDSQYPCDVLRSARTTASEETRIAVALILMGE
jgi:hypothetical protein